MKQKILFIMAAVGLLFAFFAATVIYRAQEDDKAAQIAQANRAALMRDHSPVLGKADAPVVIVEFIDPACETCRTFYPLVKEILAANPDRIRLVMRYAPFHPGSDAVVAVLEAARKQGKFWPTLEALLTSQSEWTLNHTSHVSLVWKHLEGLGLDLDKVRADMSKPETTAVIAQDLADARTLDVTKTPGYFVNGKPLAVFGLDPLKALVEEALNETRQR